ncbi:hypothetical protein [Roseateles violae]|uniref:Uncharacterized protein n=1 Tax=Roseateles violae TaxID=3058042 RepID=A0ABT8DT82_9BURK|nr:hypothetical protein [Pelomonas sp. PFR6]MDN3921520.1 hypothetical protein [Pelomonas sp. PFR6]
MTKLQIRAIRAAKQTGAFLLLHEHEDQVLMTLAPWVYRLFVMLLRCASHKTGQGETSYAHLVRLMTPIQPRSGPKHFVPDVQAIKKVIRQLEDRRILSRDKLHSQAEGRLLFMVAPRYAEARPLSELEPLSRTPSKARKGPIHRGSDDSRSELEPQTRTPLTTGIQGHIETDELSTKTRVIPEPPGTGIPADSISIAAGEKFGPPRGPDTRPAGAGHAPPASPTTRAMRARLNQSSAPQGARPDAPQGATAAKPPSARIRRPSNAVLKVDAGGGLAAKPPAGDADGPMCPYPRLSDGLRWMTEDQARAEPQE